jgi:hypothetical protein
MGTSLTIPGNGCISKASCGSSNVITLTGYDTQVPAVNRIGNTVTVIGDFNTSVKAGQGNDNAGTVTTRCMALVTGGGVTRSRSNP